jgi:glycosyltransferase involved in cell wall biosynthesis
MESRIRELAPGMDAVHFDMLPLMRNADAVPATIPVIYNAHNVEHVLLSTRVQMTGNPWIRRFLQGQLPRLRTFERHACERANLVLACSSVDAEALRQLAPDASIAVVANGVDLDKNQPAGLASDAARNKLVFVGQMGWFPNRDGVEWFLDEVFPLILASRPDTTFVLVGKADTLTVPRPVAARVILTGFVPDLRPFVEEAAVYVVPLRAGSGTRLKVLEAMALGKAIVTTSIGSEGIALHHGDSALYANDARSFADATLQLLDAPAEAQRMGAAARACAEAHYGWEAVGHQLLACYQQVLQPRPPPSPTKGEPMVVGTG